MMEARDTRESGLEDELSIRNENMLLENPTLPGIVAQGIAGRSIAWRVAWQGHQKRAKFHSHDMSSGFYEVAKYLRSSRVERCRVRIGLAR